MKIAPFLFYYFFELTTARDRETLFVTGGEDFGVLGFP